MKLFLLLLLCALVLVGCADCQKKVVITKNTIAVEWDPPEAVLKEDGSLVPLDGTAVFSFKVVTTDFPNHGLESGFTEIAIVSVAEQVVPIPVMDKEYDIGVQCQVTFGGKTYPWSQWLWASIGGVNKLKQLDPFIVILKLNVGEPTAIRVKS